MAFGSMAPTAPMPTSAFSPGASPLLDMVMKMQRSGGFQPPRPQGTPPGQPGQPGAAPGGGMPPFLPPQGGPGGGQGPLSLAPPSPGAGPGLLSRVWGSLAPGKPAPFGIDPNSGQPITADVAQGAAAGMPPMMQGHGPNGW